MGNVCNLCSLFQAEEPKPSALPKPLSSSQETQETKAETAQPARGKKGIEDYDFLKILGRGSFGVVVLSRDKASKKVYAIKIVPKKKLLTKNFPPDRILTEKKILSETVHPHIIHLNYSFQDAQSLYFVMQFLPGGSLNEHIAHRFHFSETRVRFYAVQVLSGLHHLHIQKKVLYRDLKPENILLDSKGDAKLSDFGLSKIGKTGGTFCGTPEYLAPEILNSSLTREPLHSGG